MFIPPPPQQTESFALASLSLAIIATLFPTIAGLFFFFFEEDLALLPVSVNFFYGVGLAELLLRAEFALFL